jgi:hypothetical protein
VVRGLYAIGRDSGDELARLLGERQAATMGPVDALFLAQQICEDGLLLYSNAHRFWNDPGVMQGIWDLRDPFKATGRMLVLLAAPGATLPPELGQDVLVLDEPLPSTSHLEQIVRETFNAAELGEPERSVIVKAVDALIGLAAFPAEQALAISLVKRQLDTEDLWERKRQIIEQTPGLSVWRGGETFEDIGGVENVKDFLRAVLRGVDPPRVVVFIDEIEKAFAGTGTDLSGVKAEMTGTILTFHVPRLSRSRRCAKWRPGSLSAPRHRAFTSTRRTRQRPGDASCGIWMGRSLSCHPRNPRPEYPLPNHTGIASGSSTTSTDTRLLANQDAILRV